MEEAVITRKQDARRMSVRFGEGEGALCVSVPLSTGLRNFRKFLRLKSLLASLAGKDKQDTEEFISLVEETVEQMLGCVFAPADVPKILAFFDGNHDEAAEQLLPWLENDWKKAMLEERERQAKERINGYLES